MTFRGLARWTQRPSDSLKILSGQGQTSGPLASFLAAPTLPVGPSFSPNHANVEVSESLSHCLLPGFPPCPPPLTPPVPLFLSRCVVSGWDGQDRTWCSLCLLSTFLHSSVHSALNLAWDTAPPSPEAQASRRRSWEPPLRMWGFDRVRRNLH